jgi:EAL domain-containing protein (putative c-di-GMP-specific phosphodiesterase class I)
MTRAEPRIELDDLLACLPCQAAVVDLGGNVVFVNDAWSDFAETHPGDIRACAPGADLLEACVRADERGLESSLRELLASGHGTVSELVGALGALPFRMTARLLPHHKGALLTCWPAVEVDPAPRSVGAAAFTELHDHLVGLVSGDGDPTNSALAIIGLEQDSLTDTTLPPEVCSAVADRVQRACRPGDLVTHSGPQELCVLMAGVLGEIHAIGIAERLLDVVLAPLLIDDRIYELAGHVGVVSGARLVPLRDPETTIAAARNAASQHELRRRPRRSNESATATELDRALAEDEFVLHYQPLYTLHDGQLLGFEALIRWQHPERGLVFPDGFIAIAEQTGRIAAIGAWALRRACADALRLPAHLEVAVNISANQLRSRFDELVHDCLDDTGLAPERLCLEITESLVMADPDLAAAVLGRLTRHGVRVAIDDFGTGYSSLARLRDLTLHRIKIDQSFVRELTTSALDQKIVAAVTQLGHTLGVEVVAEGVETEEQLRELRAIGCDHVQGYLLGRPGPLEELLGN